MSRFALSDQQLAVCALDQRSRAGVAQAIVAIDGGVDAAILERAWHGLVARHEIFRTSFSALLDHDALAQTPVDACVAEWTAVVCASSDDETATVRQTSDREADKG